MSADEGAGYEHAPKQPVEQAQLIDTAVNERTPNAIGPRELGGEDIGDRTGLLILILVLLAFLAVALLFFGSGFMHVDLDGTGLSARILS